MTPLERAKMIIKEHYKMFDCGIFDCRNLVGDLMETIYKDDDMQIDVCYHYCYFEVFGLNIFEFMELKNYYFRLREGLE